MTFSDVFKLLDLNLDVDGKSRTWDLALGPFKFNNFAFRTPNLLIGDRRMVGELLSECFIERRVMWKDFRQETPTECLSSLDELTNLLEQNIVKLQPSEAEKDKTLAEILSLWKARGVVAQKELKDAVESGETIPTNGQRGSSTDSGNADCTEREIEPLTSFRIETLPIIGFLIDLLPDGDPVKSDAQECRTTAQNDLVRFYSVSVDQLRHPDWQISSPI
jgi:hypothetical protein